MHVILMTKEVDYLFELSLLNMHFKFYYFIILLLLSLSLVCVLFLSVCLRRKVGSFIFKLSSFFKYEFKAINFLLSIVSCIPKGLIFYVFLVS